MSDSFTLDPRLASDSVAVASLGLCDLRLMNDARFAWLLLVPRRAGMAEIIEMEKPDRAVLFEEIVAAMAALKAATGCDKLNVAALGNRVRQLHVHVIARFAGDAAWPDPVWGAGAAVAYEPQARDRLIADVSAAFAG
jgi:diadenosine tetraphosphate (Ap4A) HIT family hydrolase